MIRLSLIHIYPFFWDQLEKANLFLQGIIDTSKSPLTDKTCLLYTSDSIFDKSRISLMSWSRRSLFDSTIS